MEMVFDFNDYDLNEYTYKEEDSIDYCDRPNTDIEKIEIGNYKDKKNKVFKKIDFGKSILKFTDKMYDEIEKQKKEKAEIKKKEQELENEKRRLTTQVNNLNDQIKILTKEKEDLKKNNTNDSSKVSQSEILKFRTDLQKLTGENSKIKEENSKMTLELKYLKEENFKINEERNKIEDKLRKIEENYNKKEEQLRKSEEHIKNSQINLKEIDKLKENFNEELKKYSSAYYCNLSLLNEVKSQNKNLLKILSDSLNNQNRESAHSQIIESYKDNIKSLENEIMSLRNKFPNELMELPKIQNDENSSNLQMNTNKESLDSLANTLIKSFLRYNSNIYDSLIDSEIFKRCFICGKISETNYFKILDCNCYHCKDHSFTVFDKNLHNKKLHKI